MPYYSGLRAAIRDGQTNRHGMLSSISLRANQDEAEPAQIGESMRAAWRSGKGIMLLVFAGLEALAVVSSYAYGANPDVRLSRLPAE